MDIKSVYDKLVSTAKSCLDKPYKYSAEPREAPNVFDCSSLTQYLYKQIGIDLPRTTINQAHLGNSVSIDKLQIGDLLFFHGTVGYYNEEFPQGIGHVMMYIGDNNVLQASGQLEKVVETSIDDAKKRNDLIVIKRIL